MNNQANLKVKFKLFFPLLVSFIIISVIVSFALEKRAKENSYEIAKSGLELEVRTLSKMIDREHTKMLNQVKSHIKVANHLFYQEEIGFSKMEFEIEIENQITQKKQRIKIKSLQRNGKNILNSSDFVDLTDSLFGGTTTIFQKIEDGYLRISTNVPDNNNKRAIGTFIPNTSEVIKTIENGNKYYGRAYVVNDWYITAYEPIYVNDSLCGMLYVGIIENKMDVLAETLAKLKIGKTGFAFVFEQKGELIISPKKTNSKKYVNAIIKKTANEKGIIQFDKKNMEVIAYQYNPKTHLYVAANMKLKTEVEEFVKSFVFYLIITNIIAILAFFTVVLLTTPGRLLRLINDVKSSKLKFHPPNFLAIFSEVKGINGYKRIEIFLIESATSYRIPWSFVSQGFLF